ncbi:MAG TPA: MFS transporter [Rhizomicrobium sp.]|nr:MFS transporter [Rhizomicrobium sp.]
MDVRVAEAAAFQGRRMGLVVTASAAGTVFEWYDFFIFGSLASIIATHFFSGLGETTGFILALLTFAAGFFVRPFGALFFGRIGDRVGRKRAFLVTMTIMGLATVAVGCLGDTKQWGSWAPFALVGLRVLQGFAIGGEYGGAAIYVAEHAAPGRRGSATGWIQASASFGVFLALAVVFFVRKALGEDAFLAWGWRVPFLLSAVLLAISLWIRLRLNESPLFLRMQEEDRASDAPIAESFFRWPNLKIVLIALVGLLMGQGVVWYTAQFYTQFFLERVIKVEPLVVYSLMMTISVIGAVLHVVFAWLSDKVGRKPVMLLGLLLAVLCYFPGFRMLTEAANPALAAATAHAPIVVSADPQTCSLQFDLIGKATFSSACDIAKSALANAGVPYRNSDGQGSRATVTIGKAVLQSPDGSNLAPKDLAATRAKFAAALKRGLAAAGYPTSAQTSAIDFPRTLAILLVFITAAAALYGPQAAALVELFPTRIRYTALSVPYHVGVGWFGGFLPATAFAIVAATGDIYAGLWYPVIVAVIGFIVTFLLLPETFRRKIDG